MITRNELEQLIERQKNRICKLAYCYLHNVDEVQDVYQEVMERYLKHAPEFESEEHEKAWFITVTSNLCKNMCESSWKKKVESYDAIADSEDGSNQQKVIQINEYHEKCVEEEEELSDGEELMAELVLKLPEKYKLVIHLFYYEELDTQTIAKMAGESSGAVRTQLNRARGMLKKMYEEQKETELKGGDGYERSV